MWHSLLFHLFYLILLLLLFRSVSISNVCMYSNVILLSLYIISKFDQFVFLLYAHIFRASMIDLLFFYLLHIPLSFYFVCILWYDFHWNWIREKEKESISPSLYLKPLSTHIHYYNEYVFLFFYRLSFQFDMVSLWIECWDQNQFKNIQITTCREKMEEKKIEKVNKNIEQRIE